MNVISATNVAQTSEAEIDVNFLVTWSEISISNMFLFAVVQMNWDVVFSHQGVFTKVKTKKWNTD